MIQDIGVEQLKNEYHPKPPKDESRIMIFDAGKLLCRINEEMQIAYPKYSEWRKNKADADRCVTKALSLFHIKYLTSFLFC